MSHDQSILPDGQLAGDTEDPRPMSTWMIGVCSIILFAVICLAVAAMFYGAVHRETKRKVVSVRTQATQLMREARAEFRKRTRGFKYDPLVSKRQPVPVDLP